jgi:hypothetical protein
MKITKILAVISINIFENQKYGCDKKRVMYII